MRGTVETINEGIVNRKLIIMLHTHYTNIVNIFPYEIRGTESPVKKVLEHVSVCVCGGSEDCKRLTLSRRKRHLLLLLHIPIRFHSKSYAHHG